MAPAARVFVFLTLALALSPAATAAETRYAVPAGTSPFIGPVDAPVVIVEFIDYQ